MIAQLDLFAPEKIDCETPEYWWRLCWPEWEGPRVGGFGEFHYRGDFLEEDGSRARGWWYCLQFRFLEHRPDGMWLVVIENFDRDGKPWHENGRRLVIDSWAIWAPVKLLSKARRETAT